jgi:hypothetical protein
MYLFDLAFHLPCSATQDAEDIKRRIFAILKQLDPQVRITTFVMKGSSIIAVASFADSRGSLIEMPLNVISELLRRKIQSDFSRMLIPILIENVAITYSAT